MSKMIRISIVVIMSMIGAYFLMRKQSHMIQENVLKIGIAADYAPYISINQNGAYEGFDIDIAYALAEVLHKKVVFQDYGSMSSLFMALDQGSVDMLIWGISITNDRQKKVDFVHYHGGDTATLPLIFYQQPSYAVTSLDDMTGKRICVEPASAQAMVLNGYEDRITIIPTERIDDAFLMLQQGKADAALVDPVIAKKFKMAQSMLYSVEIPLQEKDKVYGMGIPVKKGNDELRAEIQKGIDLLKEQGVIVMLERKWGLA